MCFEAARVKWVEGWIETEVRENADEQHGCTPDRADELHRVDRLKDALLLALAQGR